MDHTSSSITADRLVAANDAAWRFWRWHAARPGEWTSAYLAQRGLRGLAAGLAPAGWSRLAPTLRRRGFTDDELVAAGLAVRATNGAVGDAFRDRLVLPIRDDQDQIIGFTARRNPATDGDDEPPAKYINTTSTPVYDKSAALYVGQRTALRASLLEHARPSVHALIDQTLDGYDLKHVEGCLAALRHVAVGLAGHATADTMVQASAYLQTRLGHRLEPASITHELVEASTTRNV